MNINKENFNKLSQLDRIEFRQRKVEIDKKYQIGTTSFVIWVLNFYFIIWMISNIYCILIGSPVVIEFNLWIFIILPMGFAVDVLGNSMNGKRTRELCEEYFKIEIKKTK